MHCQDKRCIARIWKNKHGKEGHGSRCKAKVKIGEFCGRHGKPSTRRVKCKEPKCPWFGKYHDFAWEHCGRYDEPPPLFFRNLNCFAKSIKDKNNLTLTNSNTNMLNFGLENHYVKNKITMSEFDEMVMKKVENKLSDNSIKIELTHDLTKESQIVIINVCEFNMDSDNIDILNQLGQKIGTAKKWEDRDIPDKFKSKDGIVLDPDTNEELYEFNIVDQELSTIPTKTYREYIYSEDFDLLQPSYEVEYIDDY